MENKIVTAIFKDSTHTKVSDVWQYDYGQILRIQGLDLPTAVEVDFAVAGASESIARIGTTKDGVTDVVIPDSLIETGKNLVAYIYLRDSASGNTEYQIDMLVTKRAKPEAYDRPEDKELFGQAIEAVNTAADRAEKAGKTAQEAATKTGQDAEQTAQDRVEVAKMVETVTDISEQVKKVEDLSNKAQAAATKTEADAQQTAEDRVEVGKILETVKDVSEQVKTVDESVRKAKESERAAEGHRTAVEEMKNSVEQTASTFPQTVQEGVQAVENAGTAEVHEITQAGTAQKAAVEAAGTQAVESVENVQQVATEAVETAKTEAVQAVTAEGTKQIKAVQAAAQEIAADREQIKTNKADIADLMQTKAGAIINSARGERIAVGDSSGAFFEGLKLFGKSEQIQTKGYQLFDASKIPTKSIGGATITNNGDGSFTIGGSGNLTTNVCHYHTYSHEESIQFLKAGNIYLKQNGDTNPKALLLLYRTTDSKTVLQLDNETTVGTITDEMLNYDDLAFRIYIHAQSGQLIKPGTVKPMLYQSGDGSWEPFTGGKPSPSMEYKQDPESSGDGGNIGLEVFGKNLCPISSMPDREDNTSGNTYLTDMPICEKYTLSCNVTKYQDDTRTKTRITIVLRYSDGTNKEFRSSNDADNSERDGVKRFKTVTATLDKHKKLIGIIIRALDYSVYGGTLHAIAENIQLECGSEATDFVPYQDLRSTQFSTPNGLLGLPVDSGGNYTDSNGQQWVCDEMDFGRGKHVQRVKKAVFNGSEDWDLESISQKGFANFYVRNLSGIRTYSNVLSNQFKNQTTVISETTEEGIANLSTLYVRVDKTKADNANKFKEFLKTNNLEICYQLATPIETDIPEETMTAYRKLYTNYPSTVIQNDSGAGMELDYVADTKLYIDNKVSANVASIISQYQLNTANLLSLMPIETQATMIENDTNNILENAEEMKHE